MPSAHINLLAVITAAVATFALGAAWYSPALFGKVWMQVHGYTPEKMAVMQKSAVKAYGVSFVCYLVMAFVLAHFVDYTGTAGVAQGLWLGFLAWLGFAATIGLTANMFSEQPLAAYLLDAGYQLAYLLIMGLILAVWQ